MAFMSFDYQIVRSAQKGFPQQTFLRHPEGFSTPPIGYSAHHCGVALAAFDDVFVINTIHVDVRDVTDSTLLPAIRQAVKWTFRHLAGAWDVRVSASNDPGRWDLHVYGAFGHHVTHILTSPDRLAEQIERRLRAFLCGVVPPLSAAPRRPVLVVGNRSYQTLHLVPTQFQAHRKAS